MNNIVLLYITGLSCVGPQGNIGLHDANVGITQEYRTDNYCGKKKMMNM